MGSVIRLVRPVSEDEHSEKEIRLSEEEHHTILQAIGLKVPKRRKSLQSREDEDPPSRAKRIKLADKLPDTPPTIRIGDEWSCLWCLRKFTHPPAWAVHSRSCSYLEPQQAKGSMSQQMPGPEEMKKARLKLLRKGSVADAEMWRRAVQTIAAAAAAGDDETEEEEEDEEDAAEAEHQRVLEEQRRKEEQQREAQRRQREEAARARAMRAVKRLVGKLPTTPRELTVEVVLTLYTAEEIRAILSVTVTEFAAEAAEAAAAEEEGSTSYYRVDGLEENLTDEDEKMLLAKRLVGLVRMRVQQADPDGSANESSSESSEDEEEEQEREEGEKDEEEPRQQQDTEEGNDEDKQEDVEQRDKADGQVQSESEDTSTTEVIISRETPAARAEEPAPGGSVPAQSAVSAAASSDVDEKATIPDGQDSTSISIEGQVVSPMDTDTDTAAATSSGGGGGSGGGDSGGGGGDDVSHSLAAMTSYVDPSSSLRPAESQPVEQGRDEAQQAPVQPTAETAAGQSDELLRRTNSGEAGDGLEQRQASDAAAVAASSAVAAAATAAAAAPEAASAPHEGSAHAEPQPLLPSAGTRGMQQPVDTAQAATELERSAAAAVAAAAAAAEKPGGSAYSHPALANGEMTQPGPDRDAFT